MIKINNMTNEQKEKRLRKLKYTLIETSVKTPPYTHIGINFSQDLYKLLLKNNKRYFYVPLDDAFHSCLFSPTQALDILRLLKNKTSPPYKLKLTEGRFYRFATTKYAFVNTGNRHILSPKEIEELKNWLTEILTIGGYLNTNNKEEKKTTSSKSVIKYRIKDNTIYATDGKNTGKAICNTKLDTFDEKKGKLIATMRALGFDKKTEERVIDALFGETVNTKELLKTIDELIIER